MQSVDEYNIFREFVLYRHITVLDINDITLIFSIQHKTRCLSHVKKLLITRTKIILKLKL